MSYRSASDRSYGSNPYNSGAPPYRGSSGSSRGAPPSYASQAGSRGGYPNEKAGGYGSGRTGGYPQQQQRNGYDSRGGYDPRGASGGYPNGAPQQVPGGYHPQPQSSGPRTYGGAAYAQNTSSHPSASSTSRYDHLYGQKGYNAYYSNAAYEDTYFNSREEQDREVMKVHQEIDDVKQQSLASTRNAVSRLREAEENAGNTMRNLDEQSESLKISNSRLNRTEVTAASAASRTEDLQRANKNFLVSTFLPGNPFSKSKRREKKLQKGLKEEDKKNWSSEDTLNNGSGGEGSGRDDVNGGYDYRNAPLQSNWNGPKGPSRGNMLAHEENCQVESEIDQNLDYMGDSISRLKQMAISMGEQVAQQNKVIGGMETTAEKTGVLLERSDRKLRRM